MGTWESVKAQAAGRIDTDDLEFRPVNPGMISQDSGYVTRWSVVSEKGTYRVDSGTLHLSQLGSGIEDVIPVSFDCDAYRGQFHSRPPAKVHWRSTPSGLRAYCWSVG